VKFSPVLCVLCEVNLEKKKKKENKRRKNIFSFIIPPCCRIALGTPPHASVYSLSSNLSLLYLFSWWWNILKTDHNQINSKTHKKTT
jgi:hypothetical protein